MNNTNTMKTTIFTDGSSRGNPGRGGWGAVVIENGVQVIELGGHEKMTTNNRMELTACFQGLSHASDDSEITVLTDSSYVINGITKWIHGWKKNDWKKLDHKTRAVVGEVLNRDLWEKLDEARSDKKVSWKYVGGHIGIVGNERCDHIATDFADGNEIKLYKGPLSGYDLPNILDISFDNVKASSKKSESSRSRAKAYSYVSSVDGVIETHHTWGECEQRVKGTRGARYKKSLNIADEAGIIAEFEAL